MKLPQKRIELVHFQITKNCNLRCPFCGQWGGRGFFASANGEAVTFDEWLAAARQLKELNPLPKLMLWGGEPLVCPFFDKLAKCLSEMGFTLQAVTNGTLIHLHSETLNRYFEKIYVSIDGLRELHDSIRGGGVFEKVNENLLLLDKSKVTIMTVATPSLEIEPFAEYFRDYPILLQNLIALNKDEIGKYKKWLKTEFLTEATEIESWEGTGYVPKADELRVNVTYLPHGSAAANPFCLSPFRHIHITWNGNVLYCTDFYDFSAGNIRRDSILSIFNNEKSEKFRKEVMHGRCITCEHCSWKNNTAYE